MYKYRFYIYLLVAYLLLAISFLQTERFWILFSITMGILLTIAFKQVGMGLSRINFLKIILGILSGVLLYLIFALGKWLIVSLKLPLLIGLTELYQVVSPREWWHYLVLMVIIIPGEELFWRGYVQQWLIARLSPRIGVFLGALLYAYAHLLSGSLLLVVAALVGGIFWGSIYLRTASPGVVILSHLIFDLFLLVLFPLL